jgi:hypothetical protein
VSSTETSPGEPKQDGFWDAAPLEPHLLYQGEVLVDMPFFSMAKETRWLWVESWSRRPIDIALKQGGIGSKVFVHDSNDTAIEWEKSPDGIFAIGRVSKRPMLVLSQTCDIQNHAFIQAAPIFPLPQDDPAFAEKVMRDEIISAFYLERHPPEFAEESYADFELIQAVHKSYIKRPDPKKHFRLGPDKILKLQQAITRFFGRPNSFDADVDKAPRTGGYLCVRCFHWNGTATQVDIEEGHDLGICPKCGGDQWTLNLGSLKS